MRVVYGYIYAYICIYIYTYACTCVWICREREGSFSSEALVHYSHVAPAEDSYVYIQHGAVLNGCYSTSEVAVDLKLKLP